MKEKKFDDIVEKVFGRSQNKSPRKISSLFSFSSRGSKSMAVQGTTKGPVLVSRFPAAIDFGTSKIKLLQLAQSPKGEIEMVAVDQESYGDAVNRDLLSRQKEALQRLLKRTPAGSAAVIGLSSSEIQVFNFVFPEMSDKELEDAIHWKLKPLRPFNVDLEFIKYSFSKWGERLASPGSPAQNRVTVVCTKLETLNQKIEMLKHHGIKTMAVEASALSLIAHKRMKEIKEPPVPNVQDETVLWMDMGAEETAIVVERAGEVCFMKRLNVTSKKLTQQLAQYCRIDEKQAEDLKQHYGLSFWSMDKKTSTMLNTGKLENKEDEPAVVFYGLISALENLVIDIEHSFKYFAYQVSQSKITKFDRVILAGGGANLKNIELFLRVRLGVSIEKADPFKYFKYENLIAVQKNDLLNLPLGFTSAAGLAMAQTMAKTRVLNLSPGERRRSFRFIDKAWLKDPVKVGALAMTIFLAAGAPPFLRLHHYQTKSELLDRQLKISRTELSDIQNNQLDLAEAETKLLDKRTMLQSKLQLLRASGSDTTPFSDVLTKLSTLLHEEIWITRLSYIENRMSITGMTMQNELIASFIDSLKQSESFKEVTFNYTQKEPNSSIYRFEVVMNVR